MNSSMTPEQFKNERERLRSTAQEMADLLGVSQRAIFYYENGQRKIPLVTEKLINALYLVGAYKAEINKLKKKLAEKGSSQ